MPCGPAELRIPSLDNTPSGSWGTVEHLPLLGMRRRGNTCYVLSVSQVLLRVPAVVEWARQHHSQGCAAEETSCVVCSLWRTYQQLLQCAETRSVEPPPLAKEKARVGWQFRGNRQHDVFEFFDEFLACARRAEIAAGRSTVWPGDTGGHASCYARGSALRVRGRGTASMHAVPATSARLVRECACVAPVAFSVAWGACDGVGDVSRCLRSWDGRRAAGRGNGVRESGMQVHNVAHDAATHRRRSEHSGDSSSAGRGATPAGRCRGRARSAWAAGDGVGGGGVP